MTLQGVQALLADLAEFALKTGAPAEDVEVEIYAQDGALLRIEARWRVQRSTYSATVRPN